MNRCIITGNLGVDPELRHTASQAPVTSLSVGVTDKWTNKEGEKQESTEWFSVVVWGKQAENCAKYLTKGKKVLVEGKIQTRSWDDKDDATKKHYKTELVAQNVEFLSPSASAPTQQQGGAPGGF